MNIVIILGVAIFIGIMAQVEKGRTGAAWAIGTLILEVFLWVAIFYPSDADMRASNSVARLVEMWGGNGADCRRGGAVMGVIVGTLPKKN